MLLPFEQYQKYGGKLEEAAYDIYGYEAERKVSAFTFGRVKKLTEPVGRLLARLADILSEHDIAKNKVSSWSNDGVSESYQQVTPQDIDKQITDLIRDYLSGETDEDGTPLLYRGVSLID